MLKISAQSEQLSNLVVKGLNGQEDNIFWFQLFMDLLFEAKTFFFRIAKILKKVCASVFISLLCLYFQTSRGYTHFLRLCKLRVYEAGNDLRYLHLAPTLNPKYSTGTNHIYQWWASTLFELIFLLSSTCAASNYSNIREQLSYM
jgi:hypothetical protein